MEVLKLGGMGLLVGGWLFTLGRVYTGSYPGRYTRKKWLLSVSTTWGLLAYWLEGDQQRTPRIRH